MLDAVYAIGYTVFSLVVADHGNPETVFVFRGCARRHGVTDTMPYHRHCRVFSEVDFDNFSGEAKNFFLNKDCFIINCLYKVS